MISLYAIPPLVGTVVFTFYVCIALWSRPRSKAKAIFGALCAATLLWQAVWLATFFIEDADLVFYLAKLAYVGIFLIPFVYYHFIVEYLGQKTELGMVRVFYAVAAGFLLTLPTPWVIEGNAVHAWGDFTKPGDFYFLFVVATFVSFGRGLWIIASCFRNPSLAGISLNQLRYVAAAMVIYVFCSVDFFQVYGARWYPVGTFFFLASIVVVSLAIFGYIAEISAQNEKLEEELQRRERLKSVGILAAGMAHEIKNPLTTLKTFFESLPERRNDEDFIRKYADLASRETERVEQIIKDLLEFSKPNLPVRSRFDVGRMVEGLLGFLGPSLIKNGIDLDLSCLDQKGRERQEGGENAKDGEQEIFGDESQIKQAVLNVLLNAIEAMKVGGEIGSEIAGSRLIVECGRSGECVLIRVRDTGKGIPEEKLKHIFDPFFSTKKEGTGLGLAVTHSFVERNGGSVTALNRAGGGAEFVFAFPAAGGHV